MEQLTTAGAPHGPRLQEARRLYFSRGELPANLVDPVILRSWERCRRFGLAESQEIGPSSALDRLALKTEQERNRQLLQQLRPIMEHVYEQIRESGSMVILADANGLLLETVGDPDFVDRADRIALTAGACWDETLCGTNAIGTALVEEQAVEVLGSEHFLEHNNFLTCCASPILGPDGRLLGVLDISGDYRATHRHTLGLARLSSSIAEKRLFETRHGQDILIAFHPRAEYLGSHKEGLAAVNAQGEVLAINHQGLEILGIRRVDAVRRDFSMVFEAALSKLIDHQRRQPTASFPLQVNGRPIVLQLRGQLPAQGKPGHVFEARSPAEPPVRPPPPPRPQLTLDTLNSGDPRLQAAIDRARKMLGRDIPIMIQGESGAGKEMFAKAYHNSGPRHAGPFVALNCAAIPETLIESELFGYQGGAFTGARREGAPGKIQQADGGTLFLDEIGDMPLALQARLLRVLQERSVTPLGSTRPQSVDISLVCATHRRLREEVASGRFREDLYYRLNGLSISLPPLRERQDIRSLVDRLAAGEAGDGPPIRFTEGALQAIEAYDWPGNIRQLFNVIRVAIALRDDERQAVNESHLPEELFEPPLIIRAKPNDPWAPAPLDNEPASLEEIGRQAALRAVAAAGGNLSAAARDLGISRNTLYRKLGKR